MDVTLNCKHTPFIHSHFMRHFTTLQPNPTRRYIVIPHPYTASADNAAVRRDYRQHLWLHCVAG